MVPQGHGHKLQLGGGCYIQVQQQRAHMRAKALSTVARYACKPCESEQDETSL